MANIKLQVTPRQLQAVMDITDTISAMIGVGSDFDEIQKEVRLVDKMLKKNGYKRKFN